MWCWSRLRIRRRQWWMRAPVVSTLVVSGKTAERVGSMAGVLADWMDGEGPMWGWPMWRTP